MDEKKLFFFGQPGCLKVKFDIPIRPPNESSNQSEEKGNSDENSANNDDQNAIKKPAEQSDEDSQDLLKKIDDVLAGKSASELQQKESKTAECSIQDDSQNESKEPVIEDENEPCTNKVLNNENNENESESALEITPSASIETITVKSDNVKSVEELGNHEKCTSETPKHEQELVVTISEIRSIPLENDSSNETENNEKLSKEYDKVLVEASLCESDSSKHDEYKKLNGEGESGEDCEADNVNKNENLGEKVLSNTEIEISKDDQGTQAENIAAKEDLKEIDPSSSETTEDFATEPQGTETKNESPEESKSQEIQEIPVNEKLPDTQESKPVESDSEVVEDLSSNDHHHVENIQTESSKVEQIELETLRVKETLPAPNNEERFPDESEDTEIKQIVQENRFETLAASSSQPLRIGVSTDLFFCGQETPPKSPETPQSMASEDLQGPEISVGEINVPDESSQKSNIEFTQTVSQEMSDNSELDESLDPEENLDPQTPKESEVLEKEIFESTAKSVEKLEEKSENLTEDNLDDAEETSNIAKTEESEGEIIPIVNESKIIESESIQEEIKEISEQETENSSSLQVLAEPEEQPLLSDPDNSEPSTSIANETELLETANDSNQSMGLKLNHGDEQEMLEKEESKEDISKDLEEEKLEESKELEEHVQVLTDEVKTEEQNQTEEIEEEIASESMPEDDKIEISADFDPKNNESDEILSEEAQVNETAADEIFQTETKTDNQMVPEEIKETETSMEPEKDDSVMDTSLPANKIENSEKTPEAVEKSEGPICQIETESNMESKTIVECEVEQLEDQMSVDQKQDEEMEVKDSKTQKQMEEPEEFKSPDSQQDREVDGKELRTEQQTEEADSNASNLPTEIEDTADEQISKASYVSENEPQTSHDNIKVSQETIKIPAGDSELIVCEASKDSIVECDSINNTEETEIIPENENKPSVSTEQELDNSISVSASELNELIEPKGEVKHNVESEDKFVASPKESEPENILENQSIESEKEPVGTEDIENKGTVTLNFEKIAESETKTIASEESATESILETKEKCSQSMEFIESEPSEKSKEKILESISSSLNTVENSTEEPVVIPNETDDLDSNKVESPIPQKDTEELVEIIEKPLERKNQQEFIETCNQMTTKNDSDSSSVEKPETVPAILITDEENLNEKVADSQVESFKNDNKSSNSESSSTFENSTVENEFLNNLHNKQQLPIERNHDIIENKTVLQKVDEIQGTSHEIVVENLSLRVEKQLDPVIKDEDILIKSDINKFHEKLHSEVSVANMIAKETPEEELQFQHQETVRKIADIPEPPSELETQSTEANSSVKNELSEVLEHKVEDESNRDSLESSVVLESNDASCESKPIESTIESFVTETTEQTVSQEPEKIQEKSEPEEEPVNDKGSSKIVEPPVDPLQEADEELKGFDSLLNQDAKLDSIPITKSLQKPVITRKRKLTDRKSISESDSDGGSHFVTDSVSNDKSSDEEETVATKKPRIRNKITATRNTRATRQSARVTEVVKSSPEANKSEENKSTEDIKPESEEKTLQNFKFDYDENEDVVANIAAIKTLICKEPPKKEEDDSIDSSDDESAKKKPLRRGRKGKRGRTSPRKDAQESSSDESKSAQVHESKRSKTSESEDTTEKQSKKKRNSTGKGLLKHLDTSLVIDTTEAEAPIRQSRRIAQQKIREETERRQMEEKMLKQMKEEAERKKKLALIPEPPDEEKEDSDESYQDSRRKKKKKLKPTDKPWQTSSSHSEHSETEDEFERPVSEDPGSPLFRSDHEFSPESDDDDAPAQPVKRARTAKKQVAESSSDDEDVNPNHACQVCHKTDCPEWILLCDECDHGYHCSCLKPIIFCIPAGNWYCPLCCHRKLVDNLTTQLDKLDALITNIKSEEIRQQKQLEIKKLTEITEENIIRDKRKIRPEPRSREERMKDSKGRDSDQESESNDEGSSSDNSSDNEPLNEYFYKLRRRNQTTTSYRFNDYDDLINSAIRDEMEEVKGMGNAGRGKDISTIIEADKEEKKLQKLEKEKSGDEQKEKDDEKVEEGEESSGSDIVRPKKSAQRKKKNRKLNNLDETSEEDQASDEDFKGSGSTNSDTEEEYSVSGSVSESSLDLPLKKNKAGQRSTRSAAKNRRYDETFIDDNSSDDEPLIKKRTKKQVDSDEEDFDANEEDDDNSASTAEDIDSDDLCDDTDTDDSSENNWPRKKKKRVASYDVKKPRKSAKKNDDGKDKAFRAGISKKKILMQSDHESEPSDDDNVKGRRRTRGKKLLYLIEDDYESDDGIKPGIGVVRPETPPEEREMFVKKQEEIKRMLAEKNTEAARQLAVPTIEPLKFSIEKPRSPSPPPMSSEEPASLSIIPKNVIEGAKALDMDYNKIKTIQYGAHSKGSEHPSAQEMSEEDLARMMEEEDFAQHQLRLVGESIGRSKLLELEVKEEAFAGFSKIPKVKDEAEVDKVQPPEAKKRAKKLKSEKQTSDASPAKQSMHLEALVKNVSSPIPNTQPSAMPGNVQPKNEPVKLPHPPQHIPNIPPLISGAIPHHPGYPNIPQRFGGPSPHNLNPQDRPSVLSSYIPRHESLPRLEGLAQRIGELRPRFEGMPPRLEGMHPRMEVLPPRMEGIRPRLENILQGQQHLRFPHPPSTESLINKTAPNVPPSQPPTGEVEEKKKGRRKKFTPLRTDLPESNVPKVAKLDTPTTSVIQSAPTSIPERVEDKSKVNLPPGHRPKLPNAPEIFNPTTNPSVITRLLQPQQRPPFGGFVEQINAASSANPNQPSGRPFPEDMKSHPLAKQVRPSSAQFAENPFVPRGVHPLYRGPPTSQPSIYGIPSHHARIPYPFHHLHPNNNLRPNMQEYGAPYNIPTQFGYYAPPAHTRQPATSSILPPHHPDHPDMPPNSARPPNTNEEQSETSEFGGLVSYFSSQQELD